MSSPACFGCGETLPGGIEICGQYLCEDCEARLVRSKAGQNDYQQWIDSCRSFWEKIKIDLKNTVE
ncbi:inhibitor of sigma-G Gin protein [Hydrogenispora ethanolica]|jgi:hypothetical protein|uniref:Inhibitor of sigma-G Gin protein n=1 Tax=Hydrogenispora ethanolica TaxID=1082276 RepID=A0A4R1QVX0_HYDET|nr:sigma factor G inhibitor Gin [Hydrogenispora ethanolica]TCL55144.1 inhibitor of sigma-G Gin protein [Hydrogenispora ethanolica]